METGAIQIEGAGMHLKVLFHFFQVTKSAIGPLID